MTREPASNSYRLRHHGRDFWAEVAILLALVAIAAYAIANMSCATSPPATRPHQDDAAAIVWRATYHEANRVPAVTWVTQGLTCARATGWLYANACVSGQFAADGWAVAVAWPAGVSSYVPTAYAHELLHAHLYAAFGDQDDGHTRGEWMTLLAQANAALGKAGL